MIVELPFPDKILWPNGRGHHMKKHRMFTAHKNWAWTAAKAQGAGKERHEAPIMWSATFYPKTRHPIDADNALASLKAYQDGLALAMGIDDKAFATPMLHWGEPVKGGRVVLVVE